MNALAGQISDKIVIVCGAGTENAELPSMFRKNQKIKPSVPSLSRNL